MDRDFTNWQDAWEYYATKTNTDLGELNEDQLLERLKSGQLDLYYQLWEMLGQKGTLAKAALPLWKFLQENPGEPAALHRYHCAAALFQLLGEPDPESENPLRQAVQWDNNGEDNRQKALKKLKRKIVAAQKIS